MNRPDERNRAPIRVVVADDQELVRSGFTMILEAQPDIRVVAEAADGRAAVAAVRELTPDIALLDVRMPEMDGLEAARQICELRGCRVIMLTTFDIDDYVFRALRVGASGFLLKDVRRDDLVHAVRVVAAGEALLAPTVTRKLIERFVDSPLGALSASSTMPGAGTGTGSSAGSSTGTSPSPAAATAAPPAVPAPARSGSLSRADAARLAQLTARELETLKLLACGHSNAEIAGRMVVSEHTVKTHVSNVLAKLVLHDRIQAVVFAYESGLITPGG
ncbi:MAG TPA: response regulator transcription factor [Actinocrinis sp.]|jgi:DNA-binding NarL/FixJ family response regulator